MWCFLSPLLMAALLAATLGPQVGIAALRLSRWLIPFGLLHAGCIALVAWFLRPEAIGLAILVFLFGGYLLPDPISFVLSPRQRRAAYRAVRYAEEMGVLVFYWQTHFVAVEPDRSVLWVCHTFTKPPHRMVLIVYDKGEVRPWTREEMNRYEIEPWL
jgi:hypothetical protein